MKVVSVNIGEKQSIKWRGRKVQTGIFKYPVNSPIFLGKTDVNHDQVIDRKYHGGEYKACYIYSADHYDYWKSLYPELEFDYGMFGENITIQGMQETDMFLGDVYQIGEAKVEITQPREPCFKLGARFGTQKVLKQFINAPYPGAYLRVLEEGAVKSGDEIKLISKGFEESSLKDVYSLMYHSTKAERDQIHRLLELNDLPPGLIKALKKRI
jgi:MOSC domain-containing protein YiiM